jgi:hypothetical protein
MVGSQSCIGSFPNKRSSTRPLTTWHLMTQGPGMLKTLEQVVRPGLASSLRVYAAWSAPVARATRHDGCLDEGSIRNKIPQEECGLIS